MQNNDLTIKNEFEIQKKELQIQLNEAKKICKQNCSEFNEKTLNEHKLKLQNTSSPEEVKKIKRSLRLTQRDYKKIQEKKSAEITKKIDELKIKYAEDINDFWKESNQEKIANKILLVDKKVDKVSKIKNQKISKVEKYFNNIIDANNQKVKEIISGNHKNEEIFIEKYSKEDDYYEAENISILHCNALQKKQKEIKYCKKTNRNLSDTRDSKIKIIENKYDLKIKSLNEKRAEISEKNKPGTKKWWSKQVLFKVNKTVTKMDQQKHLYAIKMGLIYMMPFTLAAAFFILMNNVILSTSSGGLLYALGVKQTEGLTNFEQIGGYINNATLGIMGIALSVTIAAMLGERYGIDKIQAGMVGLSTFVLFIPILAGSMTTTSDGAITDGSFINLEELGATSMFLSIITGLVGIEIYKVLLKAEWMKIKMPKQVPPAVAKSFNVIIPFIVCSFIFASASFSLLFFTNKNLKDIIQVIVEKPLSSGIESLAGAMTIRIIADGLWVMGIHGQNMIGPVVSPIYLEHLTENANLVAQGKDPIWIVTSTFMDSYTLPMDNIIVVVSLFFFSRRKDHLSIMLIAVIPSMFNISEPILFGLPIVLNPILAIPLVLGSQFAVIIAYLATHWHLATPLYIITPWTTPSIIGPYIASGGDIRCIFVALIVFGVGVATYCPFILLMNMQAAKTNPDMIVSRFSFKNKLLFRREEAREYIKELELDNKIKLKENKIV